MPLGTPGPSQIRQEIPECYQEPLSIVYLHHVSSDSRVFQPHYAQLWLNTLLLAHRPTPLPLGPGTKRVEKGGEEKKGHYVRSRVGDLRPRC
ncbi:hypothetical protein CMEL01_02563 [Colletotrichum melonis]|uniref:Uncharacterized protein n=1 Tax=Colletotrichum melonis TaxID=1209925 RepID=A0AAI9XTG4_9PEZI|nr:hypothetical protein CMEL01_02563 [Colletotrichum melonis]